MTASIIDGTALARAIYAGLGERVRRLAAHGITPGLAAVQFGDNPASTVYVRNKMRASAAVGVRSVLRHLPADIEPSAALDAVSELNADPAVHGVLVQLPLPPQLDGDRLTQSISPDKDVDGFHWSNLGALFAGRARFEPCTPRGVCAMIESSGIAISGAHAVIVGRSNIVGKPLAIMLLDRGATVTVCHTRTIDVARYTREADILIAAAGRAGLIDASMVRPGAAVIDVGINRNAAGKLVGDVDFGSVSAVAGRITPVPGGVGPMTVAMLIENTVQAAERAAAAKQSGTTSAAANAS